MTVHNHEQIPSTKVLIVRNGNPTNKLTNLSGVPALHAKNNLKKWIHIVHYIKQNHNVSVRYLLSQYTVHHLWNGKLLIILNGHVKFKHYRNHNNVLKFRVHVRSQQHWHVQFIQRLCRLKCQNMQTFINCSPSAKPRVTAPLIVWFANHFTPDADDHVCKSYFSFNSSLM